jgi:hypothetical protein
MASNVTVTVDTTDYVFTPDSQLSDSLKYQMTGSTLVLPSILTARRVYPKRTNSYPGNARTNLKLSVSLSYDVGENVAPIIFDLSVSRRSDTVEADFTLVREIFSGLIIDGELDGYFNNLSL